jgi:hypothetical protein
VSEYIEDFEDYEGDFEDDFEEEDPRLDAIHAEIERWEGESGIDLSDEDYEPMAIMADLYGKSPEESTRSGLATRIIALKVELAELQAGASSLRAGSMRGPQPTRMLPTASPSDAPGS